MKLKISFIFLVLFISRFEIIANRDSLSVHNIRKQTVDLFNNEVGILVFASGYACKNCFEELNIAILSLNQNKIFDDIGVLINCKDNIIAKREAIDYYSKFFPKYNYYFDSTYVDVFNKKVDVGFWGEYEVSITPSLLIYKNRKIRFISYDEMFGNAATKVDLQKLILNTLSQM